MSPYVHVCFVSNPYSLKIYRHVLKRGLSRRVSPPNSARRGPSTSLLRLEACWSMGRAARRWLVALFTTSMVTILFWASSGGKELTRLYTDVLNCWGAFQGFGSLVRSLYYNGGFFVCFFSGGGGGGGCCGFFFYFFLLLFFFFLHV